MKIITIFNFRDAPYRGILAKHLSLTYKEESSKVSLYQISIFRILLPSIAKENFRLHVSRRVVKSTKKILLKNIKKVSCLQQKREKKRRETISHDKLQHLCRHELPRRKFLKMLHKTVYLLLLVCDFSAKRRALAKRIII